MSHDNVIDLPRRVSLKDVPGQMRALADAIEAGQYGAVEEGIFVMPRIGDYPVVFGWGDFEASMVAMQLGLAAQRLATLWIAPCNRV